MVFENIFLGKNVEIDTSSSVNNVIIGDDVRIAKRVSAFGAKDWPLEIGKGSYIGMNCFLHGFAAKVRIGSYVSFAQNILLMTDSGPNASKLMQRVFPIQKGEIEIGDHSWIGAASIIMPGVRIGKFCVIAAGSFVNCDVPDCCIFGGTPAKFIRKIDIDGINLAGG